MSKRSAKVTKLSALTRDDVVHLVGDLDDTVVTAILRTGATYQDVEEAEKWASGDAEELGTERHGLSPAAEAVYDILVSDPGFLGAEREQ
jgi:hypothetical protein